MDTRAVCKHVAPFLALDEWNPINQNMRDEHWFHAVFHLDRQLELELALGHCELIWLLQGDCDLRWRFKENSNGDCIHIEVMFYVVACTQVLVAQSPGACAWVQCIYSVLLFSLLHA